MCCEGDVNCGIWHWWDNTAPHCTSKADGIPCLLLHVPAAPNSSTAQEKTTTLRGTVTHHSSWQCNESHRCCCHWPLAPLAIGDSRRSAVLTRYESMRLRFPRQSKKKRLRGTRYNTRDELLRAKGRSIRNINKDGRADGVRRLPNISQKMIDNGGDYVQGI